MQLKRELGGIRAVAGAVLAVAGLWGLAGCVPAIRPAPICPKIDWFEVGRRDGTEGRQADQASAGSRQCPSPAREVASAKPGDAKASDVVGDPASDSAAYLNGWNAGLTEYCTVAAGLEAGRTMQSYRNVCPEHLEKAFLQGYRAGQRIQSLESENATVASRIDALFRSINSAEPSERPRLRTQLDELRKRQAAIDQQILKAEAAIEEVKRF